MQKQFILTWDWKEQPPIDHLADALQKISEGSIHLYEVETNSDQFAIMLSTVAMTEEEINEAYNETWCAE